MDLIGDFASFFLDRGVPELAEIIFAFLDFHDLCNASVVSKVWRLVIHQERTWKLLFYRLTQESTMRRLFLNAYSSSRHQIDNYFLACQTIMQEDQQLVLNWLNGAYFEEKEPSLANSCKITCMDMNSDIIALGQSDGKIILHRRFEPLKGIFPTSHTEKNYFNQRDPALEKEFVIKSSLREISSLQIDANNILACSGKGNCFEVWDASLKEKLHSVQLTTANTINVLKLRGNRLLSASNSQESNSSLVDFWRIQNRTHIFLNEEEAFRDQLVVDIGLDSRFLVVLLKKVFSYEIAVRKIHYHSLSKSFSLKYDSRYFCGFHYDAGCIVAGSDEGKIWIWDATSGHLKRTLLRPSWDIGSISIRFNSRFLVTNSIKGSIVWNLKGALDEFLPWKAKLRCCLVQPSCSTPHQNLSFLMDDLELVKVVAPNDPFNHAGLVSRLKFHS